MTGTTMERGTLTGQSVRDALVKQLAPAMQRLGTDSLAKIKANTPVESGRLRASEGTGTEVRGNEIRTSWWADAPYAVYVEFGTSRMPARSFMRREVLPLANMQVLAQRLAKYASSPSGAFGD